MGEIQGRGSSDPFSCVLWTKYDKAAVLLSMLWLGNFDAFEWSPLKRVAHMEQGGGLGERVCQFPEESGYFFRGVIIRVECAIQEPHVGKNQRPRSGFGFP